MIDPLQEVQIFYKELSTSCKTKPAKAEKMPTHTILHLRDNQVPELELVMSCCTSRSQIQTETPPPASPPLSSLVLLPVFSEGQGMTCQAQNQLCFIKPDALIFTSKSICDLTRE